MKEKDKMFKKVIMQVMHILDKYGGYCPECSVKLFFMEGCFSCVCCGYSKNDYELERQVRKKKSAKSKWFCFILDE